MNMTRSGIGLTLMFGLMLGVCVSDVLLAEDESAETTVAAMAQNPDRSAWPGPVESQLEMRFGADGNTVAEHAEVLPDDVGGSAGIELALPKADSGMGPGAKTMLALPSDSGMALGPDQYLEFEMYYTAEQDAPWLIHIEEPGHKTMLRGRFIQPPAERGVWQRYKLNLLRNELSGDPRPKSSIPPDGTPLTRIGLWLDPRGQAGVQTVRIRNLRLYRQDVLANAPVDATDPAGQTALHRAAMMGDAARTLDLLQRGADVNATNRYLYTPLALAVISHDADTVRVLIDHGADVSAQRQLGFTPLYDAAADGLVPIMQLLMDHGADPTQKTEYGFEPLFTAVHHGHLEASVFLVNDPRVDVNRPIAGFMALHVAAQGDEAGPHVEIYERLINLGAHVDMCSAAAAGDVARINALLAQDPEAAKTTTILGGWTPLHDAVRNVRVEAVKLLLAHGADPNAVSGEIDYRSSPLHWVSENVLLDDPQVKLTTLHLMVEAGADLNPLDQFRLTPLDRARASGSRELVDEMLKLGALTGIQVRAQQATTSIQEVE